MKTKKKGSRYLVWWLTEADYCGFQPQMDKNPLKVADYIWEEFCARSGRPGHGRLWVPLRCKVESLPVDEKDPRWPEYLEAGGIVILAADAPACALWGGRFTDLSLNAVNPLKR